MCAVCFPHKQSEWKKRFPNNAVVVFSLWLVGMALLKWISKIPVNAMQITDIGNECEFQRFYGINIIRSKRWTEMETEKKRKTKICSVEWNYLCIYLNIDNEY